MTQIWVLYRQSGSDRLEKQPTDLRQYTCYFGDRTLVLNFSYNECVVVRACGKFQSSRNQNFQIVGVTNVVSSQAMTAIPLPMER